MMNTKNGFLLFLIYFGPIPFLIGQDLSAFLYTKGDKNISTITMGSMRSAQCTVIEYPDFLVVHEVPSIPVLHNNADSLAVKNETNPLLAFIDSIYQRKPIKYVLNSHHHRHSLSAISPFLDVGATLVTAKENIEIYEKRGLFSSKSGVDYSKSIIKISTDTALLVDTKSPIEVLYLKKSEYKSIPTESYLFFNFPEQKVLATSCMVYLRDINEKYGYGGIMYSNRLVDVDKIITDKNLEVENTLQLYKFRNEDGQRKPPVFPASLYRNVLKHGWHRVALSEQFQAMTYEELTSNKDSILNFLGENDIYHIVVNHAVYQLIEKKEYQKAVALAHILVLYEPDRMNEIDTLGEAYYNNGQMEMAKHYDGIIKASKQNTEGLGLTEWKTNRKNRLKSDS